MHFRQKTIRGVCDVINKYAGKTTCHKEFCPFVIRRGHGHGNSGHHQPFLLSVYTCSQDHSLSAFLLQWNPVLRFAYSMDAEVASIHQRGFSRSRTSRAVEFLCDRRHSHACTLGKLHNHRRVHVHRGDILVCRHRPYDILRSLIAIHHVQG